MIQSLYLRTVLFNIQINYTILSGLHQLNFRKISFAHAHNYFKPFLLVAQNSRKFENQEVEYER